MRAANALPTVSAATVDLEAAKTPKQQVNCQIKIVELPEVVAAGLDSSDPALLLGRVNDLLKQGRGKLIADTQLVVLSDREAFLDAQKDYNMVLQTLATTSTGPVPSATLSTIRAGIVLALKPTIQPDGSTVLETRLEWGSPVERERPNLPPDVYRLRLGSTQSLKSGQVYELGGFLNPFLSKGRTLGLVFITPRVESVGLRAAQAVAP